VFAAAALVYTARNFTLSGAALKTALPLLALG
jgi:hypothetical protein